jgi:two-component system sensor histidine kinase YesM
MPRLPKRYHSVQVTLAIAFTLLSVTLVVGAILIAFAVTEETARIGSRRYTRQVVGQLANYIEFYIGYMDSVSVIVRSDDAVQEFLRAGENGAAAKKLPDEKQTPSMEGARGILEAMINTRTDISLIGIFSYDGQFITSGRDHELNPFTEPERQSWYVNAQNARGESILSSSHVQNVIKDRYPWVISLSREIIDPETGQGKGVLLVDLNYRIIDRICGSVELGKRGYIFIVDRNGDIVYHPQQQLLYGGLKTEDIERIIAETETYFPGEGENRDKFYSLAPMYSTGWRVVGVNYRSELVENRDTIRRDYALWGVVFLTVSMAVSILLAQRISKPIKELRRSMRDVEQGNFDITADIRSSNEIGELGKDFNIMVGEIKKLMNRITVEQEQKRKSELNALQMQINPHFLYNTLDSVIWMAESGKQDEVIAMSSALARLFRLSISKGREIIDVASEIEHVKNYLTIQKIRYKDRLDYRIEVDDDIKTMRIVKIILQPLVENAIYHGIKNASAAGTVIISGYKTERGMDLVVRDDGAGMDKAGLERVRRRLDGTAGQGTLSDETPPDSPSGRGRGSGVGIRNVDERIKLYFGGSYGLEFKSDEGEGTTVYIHLPAIPREET